MMFRLKIIAPVLVLVLAMAHNAQSRISVVGDMVHEKVVAPGQNYRGAILLQNDGNDPVKIKIYRTDYLFHSDGQYLYPQAGQSPRSNANWISPRSSRLTIPAHGKNTVYYSVQVPQADTLSGTYWSMIMIQEIPTVSRETRASKKSGVKSVFRYGVQIVTHINKTGVRQLTFLGATLLNRKRILQVDIENTGERALRPTVLAKVYDEKGRHIGDFSGEKYRTYPGTSVRFKINLSKVKLGAYKVLIVADCGDDGIFEKQYPIRIE